MCGIVGFVNSRPVAADLIAALARLEYRGYDSAGLALAGGGPLILRKVVGRAADLDSALEQSARAGTTGIAHTRWATHGKPEARNAHPHMHDGVCVVHNGIIENYVELRQELRDAGAIFLSDTDSEVVPHLIAHARASGIAPLAALRAATARLHGAYAIAVLFADLPGRLFVARQGSPVMLGVGMEVGAVASDPLAMSGLCRRFAALEDGDVAEIGAGFWRILDHEDRPARRVFQELAEDMDDAELDQFEHHTRREIAEQPMALRRTLASVRQRRLPAQIAAAERLVMVACGSSLYAAAAARGVIEQLCGIPCDIEIASEFRYRAAPIVRGSVAVLVSQSGETADTLAAMSLFRGRAVPIVAVVNVAHSAIARGADLVWPTVAGREQGVAATKSFTAQLAALIQLGVALAEARGSDMMLREETADALSNAADAVREAEQLEPVLADLARWIASENEALFIGRGAYAAMAGEAALKLKELSYIRAESYAAGELKHGPIALIRNGSPAVVFAPCDGLLAKTISSAEEIRARGARVVAITDAQAAPAFRNAADQIIVLPGTGAAHLLATAVAQQLIAYHAALALGRDVDRPRNLAKSVTVE